MSRIAVALVVVVLLALILPLSNLLGPGPTNPLAELETEDPTLARIASALADKCGDCHTSEPALPFYARFPVASGMIQRDIANGRRFIDLAETHPVVAVVGGRGHDEERAFRRCVNYSTGAALGAAPGIETGLLDGTFVGLPPDYVGHGVLHG